MNAFMPVIANASPLHCAANIFISALVIPAKRISIFKDDPDNRILECAIEAQIKFGKLLQEMPKK
ncbi:MAG: hypothetical protein A2328_11900 [Bdellovibrionales bacterium RIFOXYB2_FULL_36_6]|nr:MAG: hypothetical protein A2328_11900 [Bdellovibrionales bacterium RIFOXYB2_FULL_36_6]